MVHTVYKTEYTWDYTMTHICDGSAQYMCVICSMWYLHGIIVYMLDGILLLF